MAHEFIWDKDTTTYLKKFRDKYNLNRLVSKDKNELSTLKNCVKWATNKWNHDNLGTPKHSDPISILEESEHGGRFRCVEYAIILKACLTALGIKSRTLSLRRKDVETKKKWAGHVVVESYLEEHHKWVMADPQFGTIPFLNKTPLNAVELRDAIIARRPVKLYSLEKPKSKTYIKFIYLYLFYFRVNFDQRKIRNKGTDGLILGPPGSLNPTKFEGEKTLEDNILINSKENFYQPPYMKRERQLYNTHIQW